MAQLLSTTVTGTLTASENIVLSNASTSSIQIGSNGSTFKADKDGIKLQNAATIKYNSNTGCVEIIC